MRAAALFFVVILLHTPEGGSIYIESSHMQTIRPPDHHCAPRSRSIIRFDNGGTLCVMETPDQISDAVHGK